MELRDGNYELFKGLNIVRLVLHIGYPRTASTSIQDGVFSNEEYFLSIGKPRNNKTLFNFSNKLKRVSFIIDRDQFDLKNDLVDICNNDKRIVIFSDETIITRGNAFEIITFFKEVFDTVEILLTIRSQLDLIQSFYNYEGMILKDTPKSYRFNKVKFDEFFYYHKHHKVNNIIHSLNYYDVIKTLEGIVGENKVHILCFEDFINDKDYWSHKMSEIFLIDYNDIYNMTRIYSNKPRSSRYKEYKRIINRGVISNCISYAPIFIRDMFRKSVYYFLNSGKPYRVVITQDMKREINSTYREGNRALMQEYDINLEKYNYPL
jgi:hypothetical protein